MNKFSIGDVAVLKSESARLTITSVDPHTGSCECRYYNWNDSRFGAVTLPEDALELVKPKDDKMETVKISGIFVRRDDEQLIVEIQWPDERITAVGYADLNQPWSWFQPSMEMIKQAQVSGKTDEFWTKSII